VWSRLGETGLTAIAPFVCKKGGFALAYRLIPQLKEGYADSDGRKNPI
jgi:hypothetical protein